MYGTETATWREQLLESNTLQCVVLFPPDLFYPTAVESVGIFLKKGVPHAYAQQVLWVRLDDDGFTKWKGFRIPKSETASARLTSVSKVAKAWVTREIRSFGTPGFIEFHPIRGNELIPQAHMGTAPLDQADFEKEAGRAIRDYMYTIWSKPGSVRQ